MANDYHERDSHQPQQLDIASNLEDPLQDAAQLLVDVMENQLLAESAAQTPPSFLEKEEEKVSAKSIDECILDSKAECPVCLEEFPMRAMLFCTPPVWNLDAKQQPSEPAGAPIILGTFQTLLERTAKLLVGFPHNPLTTAVVSENNTVKLFYDSSDTAIHAFCHSCVREAAKGASDDAPLAEGAIGLRCMVQNCKNPLPYAEVHHLLDDTMKVTLDKRIAEEILGLASIANLERCKKCNFPMEMEVSAEVNKVFLCPNCSAEYCRLCEKNWEGHMGLSCSALAELDGVENRPEGKKRQLEKRLTEAVIRKCSRCTLAFVKSEGCNMMTCRCGMTMCYLCRATGINHKHFSKSPATCKQYENADYKDAQLILNIKKQAAGEGVFLDDGALSKVLPQSWFAWLRS